MRQLSALLDVIHIRNTTKQYYQNSFHAKLAGAEMPPLENYLGVSSEEDAASFDPEIEREMEARAMQIFKERQLLAKLSG